MSPFAPLVGITTSLEGDEHRLRIEYVQSVEQAGGIPLILPVASTFDVAASLAALIDVLIVTGGPAVTIGMVGEAPEDLEPVDERRVASDRAYIEQIRAKSRPILGICYGMQLLNALNGGTIYADIQEQVPGTLIHSADRGAADHPVFLEEGSRLRRILGVGEVRVNSRHIQAVERIGRGYRVSARAEDGVIEAIESLDGREIGVQFHPERLDEMVPLFRYFVRVARDDTHSGTPAPPLPLQ